MSEKVSVAELNVDNISKQEFLEALSKRVLSGEKTFVTTLYSEFLYASLINKQTREMLNQADFALPDGIAILWAAKFLSIPLTAKNYFGKIVQAFWQIVFTGLEIIFNPQSTREVISHKIVGADLIWDLASMVEQKNLKVYLLGGFGNTPEVVKQKLLQKFPRLNIVGASNKNPEDSSILEDIKTTKPDFLFVAFGPLRQEKWITENLQNLPIKLAIGLGGTFDYIAGNKKAPPKFIRETGLEWAYRLITQPQIFNRIWNATFMLARGLLRYKVFMTYPYRQNALCVVFNKTKQILICKRNPKPFEKTDKKLAGELIDHWQFPQGGIQPRENITAGATRELQEETGITSVKILIVSKTTHSYIFPHALRPLIYFRTQWKYKGQQQHIVYFKFEGTDKKIVLDKKELIDYKWVLPSELIKNLHPYRKPVGEIVLDDLKNGAI